MINNFKYRAFLLSILILELHVQEDDNFSIRLFCPDTYMYVFS